MEDEGNLLERGREGERGRGQEGGKEEERKDFAKDNISFSQQHLKKLWMTYRAGKIVEPIGREQLAGEYTSWCTCQLVIVLLLTMD